MSHRAYMLAGLRNLGIGLGILTCALLWSPSGLRFDLCSAESALPTLMVLLGISLAFHSGAFQIVTALWRWRGYPARLAFHAPLRSTSLVEFWSQRWNRPFIAMTAATVYRPCAEKWGRSSASVIAFAFSGLLHELAISVPCRAGYGLPFAYFCLHGLAMRMEAFLEQRSRGPSTWGGAAYLWVLAWLLFPLPLLFHEPFLTAVLGAG